MIGVLIFVYCCVAMFVAIGFGFSGKYSVLQVVTAIILWPLLVPWGAISVLRAFPRLQITISRNEDSDGD